MKIKLKVIPATEFKARCLKIIDHVAESGQGVFISKRGKVTVKLSPLEERAEPVVTLKDSMKGRIKLRGDIVQFSAASDWSGDE